MNPTESRSGRPSAKSAAALIVLLLTLTIAALVPLIMHRTVPEPNPTTRRLRAAELTNLAASFEADGRIDEALEAYRESIAILGLIVMEFPSAIDDRCAMANSLERAGSMLATAGQWEAAAEFLRRGQKLCANSPDRRINEWLALFLRDQGLLMVEQGKLDRAQDYFAEAVQVQQSLADQASDPISKNRERLVVLLIDKARVSIARQQPEAAARDLDQARIVCSKRDPHTPDAVESNQLQAQILDILADLALRDPTHTDPTYTLLAQAVAYQQSAVESAPADSRMTEQLATLYERKSAAERIAGKPGEAEASARHAIELQSRLIERHPHKLHYRFSHGRALHNLGEFLRTQGRTSDAFAIELSALEELGPTYSTNLTDPERRQANSVARWTFCTLLLDARDHRGAEGAIFDYLDIESNGYHEAVEAARFANQCVSICEADRSLDGNQREILLKHYQSLADYARAEAGRRGYHQQETVPLLSLPLGQGGER